MKKTLYTSYFSSTPARLYPPELKFSVARKKIGDIPQLTELLPSESLLYGFKQGGISDEQYKKLYVRQLNNSYRTKRLHKVLEDLPDGALLLCFEKSSSFCHRHILADYLRTEFDIDIKELEV